MSNWGNAENMQTVFGFAPVGICMKRPGNLTLIPYGAPSSYLFKGFVSLKIYLYSRINITISLNAEEIYDLSCTLHKPFLSTSRLRGGSSKIENHIHSLQFSSYISNHSTKWFNVRFDGILPGPPLTC